MKEVLVVEAIRDGGDRHSASEASCERGGRAAILVQYDSIFIEIALLNLTALPSAVNRIHKLARSAKAVQYAYQASKLSLVQ